MICKKNKKPVPACTVRETWEGKQGRILKSYKNTGNENAFKRHCDYLKNKGCEIYLKSHFGFYSFEVERTRDWENHITGFNKIKK